MNEGPDLAEPLPLEGVRVLDFSVLLPGPACTQRLAWLGAEVTKIEPPEGDPARELYGGHLWRMHNRGKDSVRIDLKSARGRAELLDLVPGHDIVVEGFRPGVADRLGFGYRALRELQECLIYCSIAGFAADDPRVDHASHDLIFTAASGAMGEPGSWRAQRLEPTRPLVPIGDLMGSDAAVQAILAALIRRDRTGLGARFTISASDAALYAVASRTVAESNDPPLHIDPANDVYPSADGRLVAVAAVEPKFWRALCAELGLGKLGEDVESWGWPRRQAEGWRLVDALEREFARREAGEMVAALEAIGVPATVVLTPGEAMERAAERGLIEGDWMRPPLPFGDGLGPVPD